MTDEPMGKWVNEQMGTNPTEDKARLISLAEAAEMYGFNADYLRTLVNRERLQARKIGGVWITTPSNIEEYIKSRKRRGKYRDDIGLDKDS